MENLLFSKVKGTAKQNNTKTAFLCAPFTSYKLQGKNITINTFPYRHRLAWQTGWLKHMPLTSADSNLRNSSNLTASCNVKLGCLGWMRADFFFKSPSVVTVLCSLRWPQMVWLFIFPDWWLAVSWVGSRLAPFQCHGSSLLSHSSFIMKENSFSIISATSFSMLGGFHQVQPICTHLDYPITF